MVCHNEFIWARLSWEGGTVVLLRVCESQVNELRLIVANTLYID